MQFQVFHRELQKVYGVRNDTQAIIPDGFTSLGRCVFSNCKSLESVFIPESVKCIGEGAFLDCKNKKYPSYNPMEEFILE